MGQAATKERHSHDDANGGASGSVSRASKSFPSTVDGGALEPQGVYQGVQDYDHNVVKTAIVQRKLMPFYKGDDDEEKYQDRPFNTECPICFLVSRYTQGCLPQGNVLITNPASLLRRNSITHRL